MALAACQTPPGDGGALPEVDVQLDRRIAMVRQVQAMGVDDTTTLTAMRRVPRHEFVRPVDVDRAYTNQALRIDRDQTISQPFIVAHMTAAIDPRPGMKVLEVGTGSGYQAAVLAEAGCDVYTIEIDTVLADSAAARLERLGYGAVQVRAGDGHRGWPEAAPFDGIVVTAAPPEIPQELIDQLANGGRMAVPVGEGDAIQSMTLVRKDASGKVDIERGLPVRFVPLKKTDE